LKKPRYFLIVTFIVIFQIFIQAGTTGKISGTVIDSESGNPLPGANVIIEGTALGAATDAEGYYYIINVPPGSWSIQVSMMGYGFVRETQVKVVTDMTSKVHFALLPTVLEGEGVTVVSVRPAVQKDLTSSLQAFSDEDITDAAITQLSDLMEAQSGISILEEEERASVIRDTPGDGLHIRGGRENETAFLVDGIRVDNPIFGGSDFTKSSGSTVTEMMTILGTFNAEYGGKMSGVINMVTKEGSNKYSSQINFYTDNFGLDAFSRNTYHGDFILSGPVPIIKNVSFFSNTQLGVTRQVSLLKELH